MSDTKGIIFDIQRFSVNDGPGIRTSVFLKGCALECSWCHNPESWNPKPELGFIEDKCLLCKSCSIVCEYDVHSFSEENHIIERDNCTLCGQCVEACSNNALKIYGREYSVQEVFDIVVKDIVYYEESGGGVTVSGGEPLQQYKFVLELFQLLKSRKIHTCLDTSGFSNKQIIEHIIPWTDLFLFDYKLFNEKDYSEHTNINLNTIINNLGILKSYKKDIILRCPIIPAVNDKEEHINSIVSLVKDHPNIKQVDLIPYHKLGEAKFAYVGKSREEVTFEKNNFIIVDQMKLKLEKHLGIPINFSTNYAH